jgi:hypothetical protein
MSVPIAVTFRHMSPRAELEEYARAQTERLARFSGRIVEAHVLLEPSAAGVLRVVIELTVPGQRLVVSHECAEDAIAPDASAAEDPPVPEYRWLHALHEAFEAAGRVLQDYAGRRRAKARRPRLVPA